MEERDVDQKDGNELFREKEKGVRTWNTYEISRFEEQEKKSQLSEIRLKCNKRSKYRTQVTCFYHSSLRVIYD